MLKHETRSATLEIYCPRLVPLTQTLVAAVFPLMKIYPAEHCFRRALQEGHVKPETLIVETSSGNMALGLAIVCKLHGHRLTLVSDYACDCRLKRRIEDLGAHVEIVEKPAPLGGYQRSRLDRLEEIRSKHPEHWWINQYDNPANPGAYSPFAAQIVESLGKIDCLVGAVGSGGSVCGTASYLRMLFPEMVTIGVDTFGSVLFGHEDRPRMLRGLGNSLLPKNLDHTVFDEVHWVTAAEAYSATRMLHRQSGLFCGGTSGAAWMVAAYWAAKHPEARVVFICPEDGHRSIETIYDDGYLATNGLWLPKLPITPQQVNQVQDAGPSWSYIEWARRSYLEVVKTKAKEPEMVPAYLAGEENGSLDALAADNEADYAIQSD